MGCRYDHIAVDWLPPHCIDDELTSEFDGAGPNGTWPYFKLEGVSLLGASYVPIEANEIEKLAREGRDYYATRSWHVAHCMFTWRKQFRSRFSDGSMEPWNNKEGHIKHCSMYIMDMLQKGQRLDEVDTFIPGKARHDGD
ncbi:hypothetical protein CONLIGDRAFT_675602 [Coniochaeta ligniaria NRRL 30616]|uniref:Uncharacterized protein n=1 Tax=Coniochaeta ligniaria NRRL 30616 TaxID=1408157 RepID=A0A1J7K395_9PEZI|nr:hypothetical protein CONLIGDRAFT_675602 [Coniochaeta ligniaria NRRL 30616]